MNYDFECVVLTTSNLGTPHLAALAASNPGLKIHVHEALDAADETGRIDAWRNCDRNLRDAWKWVRDRVDTGRVVFLEWDVFVSTDLRDLMPPAGMPGVTAAGLRTPIRNGDWGPFAELRRMPREMRGFAIGMVPFAVLVMDREAADEIADPKWDALYEEDVFCELRTPTILRFSGHDLRGHPGWEDVGTTPMTPQSGFRGMAHPVKKEVEP